MSKDYQEDKDAVIEAIVDQQEQVGAARSGDRAEKWVTPILEQNERTQSAKKAKPIVADKPSRADVTKDGLGDIEVDFSTGEMWKDGEKIEHQRTASDAVHDRVSMLMGIPGYRSRLDYIFQTKYLTVKQKDLLVRNLIKDSIKEFGAVV